MNECTDETCDCYTFCACRDCQTKSGCVEMNCPWSSKCRKLGEDFEK